MIKYIHGNLFDSEAQCLVNPVNCVGVMGKGLAQEFKRRHPDMFITYKSLCANNQLSVGRVGFYVERYASAQPIICLFPTKVHWRTPSTIEIIDLSMQSFAKYATNFDIKTVAFPKVGCGLGGLSFEHQVRPLFDRHFAEDDTYEVSVYIDDLR